MCQFKGTQHNFQPEMIMNIIMTTNVNRLQKYNESDEQRKPTNQREKSVSVKIDCIIVCNFDTERDKLLVVFYLVFQTQLEWTRLHHRCTHIVDLMISNGKKNTNLTHANKWRLSHLRLCLIISPIFRQSIYHPSVRNSFMIFGFEIQGWWITLDQRFIIFMFRFTHCEHLYFNSEHKKEKKSSSGDLCCSVSLFSLFHFVKCVCVCVHCVKFTWNISHC